MIISRAQNKPIVVSELKAIQEVRPEETQIFSEVLNSETEKEVKEHKPSPVPPIQHMKKVNILFP